MGDDGGGGRTHELQIFQTSFNIVSGGYGDGDDNVDWGGEGERGVVLMGFGGSVFTQTGRVLYPAVSDKTEQLAVMSGGQQVVRRSKGPLFYPHTRRHGTLWIFHLVSSTGCRSASDRTEQKGR